MTIVNQTLKVVFISNSYDSITSKDKCMKTRKKDFTRMKKSHPLKMNDS